MRKLLLGTAAALAVSVAPAAAELLTSADVDKDRDKLVAELIVKVKLVFLGVLVDVTPEKFAESDALINQESWDNFACENCAEKQDNILGSANGNAGITSINQSGGSMNNQGTAIAFSVDVGGGVPDDPQTPDNPEGNTGFAEAVATVGQNMGVPLFDEGRAGNHVKTINVLFRNAEIIDSGNANSGVLYVNQSAGNINNQGNALSVAVSLVPGVALADAVLGQASVGNTVLEIDESDNGPGFVNKFSNTLSSFNGNSGIVGVNQTSGNMANQANVASLAVTLGQ